VLAWVCWQCDASIHEVVNPGSQPLNREVEAAKAKARSAERFRFQLK
jgi:hypothetical protein